MNENENNFESLRRLLALKRHETPPPGYFENFSREVTARIRAGEAKPMTAELPWLFRLLSSFETKPAFVGSFASALCLLLLIGIVYAERPDVATQPLPQTAFAQIRESADGFGDMARQASLNVLPTAQPGFVSGTNPVFNANTAAALFGSSSATVQPVNFRLQ
jgi:hypothetical protein